MAKVESHLSLVLSSLALSATAVGGEPLHRRLYVQLRRSILEGQLRPGDRLPASRTLARELGVSRTTVVRAFEQLVDEGYAEARSGSGTHVSKTLSAGALTTPAPDPTTAAELRLSGLAERLATLRRAERSVNPFYHRLPRAFSPASPALDVFPRELWGRSLQAAWRSLERADLNYQVALSTGYGPLKVALARYSQQVRGVRCTPEQIVITSGTQEALWAVTQLLLEPGDAVWTEDPGHKGAHLTFQAAAAEVVPVRVDSAGLDVAAGIRAAPGARLAYVTPSHQHPLGVTMSLGRRVELLGWAERAGAWLIEDDYDSEFRYSGPPLESLQGLDRAGRVIYLMTFSKTLFPALRLGYMVVPQPLLEVTGALLETTQRSLGLLEQVALYHFIEAGHFARHIRKMRTLYAERQNALVAGLGRDLSGLLSFKPSDAGLHLVAKLLRPPIIPATTPGVPADQLVAERLLARGVGAPALSSFCLEADVQGLLLGFTGAAEETAHALAVTKEVLLQPF